MENIYTATTKHGELNLIKYSEKCAVLYGSATYGIRTELKKIGGKFNKNLKCGAGWIFPIGMSDIVKHVVEKVEIKEEKKESWIEPVGTVTSSQVGLDRWLRKVGDKFRCRKNNCEELTDNNCGMCKKHHTTTFHDHDKKICVHYHGTLYMYKNKDGEIYFKNRKI